MVVVIWSLMACFCACSNKGEVSKEAKESGLPEKEQEKTVHITDNKAPEGTLKTHFLSSSEAVLPEHFLENVTDESAVTQGFRNVKLLWDHPFTFESEIPQWTAEEDCYEETGVDGTLLLDSFSPDQDGLYSMEVVGADCYGNASVASVYVLYVAEDGEIPWLQSESMDAATAENPMVSGWDRAKAEQAFLQVNAQREAAGIPTLSWDESLYELACIRAQEVADVFSHERPDGSYVGDVMLGQYGAVGCGENIAANYRSVTNLINGWLDSAGHRDTMLDVRFTSGVMACYCHEGTYYWVNLFKQ